MNLFSHSRDQLPEGYEVTTVVDLQKNRKQMLIVNGLGLAIAVVMLVLGFLVSNPIPVLEHLIEEDDFAGYFLRLGVFLVGDIAYVFAHEAVHGIFMRVFSPVKPKYGFTGMYAYAGSSAWFDKVSYFIIALAPVVVWGVVLFVLTVSVPSDWTWVVYLIQVMNISGAAGDLYVVARFSRLNDFLVQDVGTSMRVAERK